MSTTKKVFSVVALLFAVIIIFQSCVFKLSDRDFWEHLKAGEIMVQNHAIIKHDVFAYPRQNKPYLATQSWLSEIILYLVWHAAGYKGIIILRIVLVMLTFLLLFLIDTSNIFSPFLIVWTANLAHPGFLERPQLFTYLCFAIFMFLSFKYMETKSHRYLWLFPATGLLWVNFHGAAVLMGVMILFFLFCNEFFEYMLRNRNAPDQNARESVHALALTLLGLGVVIFCPPNTYHNFTYLFNLMGDRTIGFIDEWKPREIAIYLRSLGPLWVLAAVSFAITKERKLFAVLVLICTGYLSRKAFRHEMIFDIAAGGIIIFNLKRSAIWRQVQERLVSRPVLMAILFLGGMIGLGKYTYSVYAEMAYGEYLYGWGTFEPARGAFDFLQRQQITGNMFNTYGIGSYLIYRGYPDRPIYIDGRNVDHGFEFMNQTYFAGQVPQVWQKLDDEYHFSYAIIDYGIIRKKDYVPYCDHLNDNPAWKLVYIDDWIAIYLKDSAQNRRIIDACQYRFITPENMIYETLMKNVSADHIAGTESELRRMIAAQNDGTKARLMLARLCLNADRVNEAERWAQEVADIQPKRPEAYQILAAIALRKSDFAQAGAYYDKSVILAGDHYPNINYNFIAAVFMKAGNSEKAEFYRKKAEQAHVSQ
jgi:tetratricopeptide (TPR) repeat protein